MDKILVVDDDPITCQFLSTLFGSASCRVLTARDAIEGLTLAQTELPRLVLLDIHLPDSYLHGLDLCRLLKADPATYHIDVFMVTASAEDWAKQAARDAGADDYIVKPFSPPHLLARVQARLEKDPAASPG